MISLIIKNIQLYHLFQENGKKKKNQNQEKFQPY